MLSVRRASQLYTLVPGEPCSTHGLSHSTGALISSRSHTLAAMDGVCEVALHAAQQKAGSAVLPQGLTTAADIGQAQSMQVPHIKLDGIQVSTAAVLCCFRPWAVDMHHQQQYLQAPLIRMLSCSQCLYKRASCPSS